MKYKAVIFDLYNPVKHGVADSPDAWSYSSFNEFVKSGVYNLDWGRSVNKDILDLDLD